MVRVANEKAKGLLESLRRKLYTSEQETLPTERSIFDELKNVSFKKIGIFLLTLLIYSVFLYLLLLIPLAIKEKITTAGKFLQTFDWVSSIDQFMEYIFAPVILTIVTYLQMYVVQHPVTITHERIDADELFTEYFGKVVDRVVSKKVGIDKKLVVFVDNIDRLTDEKMVEALESLKTYINNEHCIFVVACDDSVVRSVINKSDRIPRIDNRQESVSNNNEGPDLRAGEHYLDKFFQQTFRLPDYMDIDLQDFAERNFRSTYLYDKLVSKKVDIRNLISIILPTDVGSPRKVKRLLNDFIALHDIVERREGPEEGQLRPGAITNRPEQLGKFSTLRTEYPSFYEIMIRDTGILADLTKLLNENKDKEIINRMSGFAQKNNTKSLIDYLRKTGTVNIDDLGPFIWLSQDSLSLDLRPEHARQLRTALSNGDIELFLKTLQVDDTEEYQTLLIKSCLKNSRTPPGGY